MIALGLVVTMLVVALVLRYAAPHWQDESFFGVAMNALTIALIALCGVFYCFTLRSLAVAICAATVAVVRRMSARRAYKKAVQDMPEMRDLVVEAVPASEENIAAGKDSS